MKKEMWKVAHDSGNGTRSEAPTTRFVAVTGEINLPALPNFMMPLVGDTLRKT